jgi:hypothetical protein
MHSRAQLEFVGSTLGAVLHLAHGNKLDRKERSQVCTTSQKNHGATPQWLFVLVHSMVLVLS